MPKPWSGFKLADVAQQSKTLSKSKRVRAAERRRLERRKKLLVRFGVVLGAAAFVALIATAFSGGETADGVTATDAWDLPALDGKGRVTLAEFEGKPTVAAFFASWCVICQRELPGFGELSRELSNEVNFVGINTMNNGSGLPFANANGIGHWPLARDIGNLDGRQLAVNFGARGSPTTVIYDENGQVVDVTLGALTANQLEAKLTSFFGVGG